MSSSSSSSFNRRDFLTTAALGAAAASLTSPALAAATDESASSGMVAAPVMICAGNSFAYLQRGFDAVVKGGDTLDAAVDVVRGPEDDPDDDSVGLGGLPNEEGVVELDSCCMHGPTRRAGSVGAVRDIKNVARLAQTVMLHSGHVMLVGEGASRFGFAHGFPKENLLTEHSRKVWLLWKETHSDADWWGPGIADPQWKNPPQFPAVDSKTGKPIAAVSAANLENNLKNNLENSDPRAEYWQRKLERMHEVAAGLGIEPEFRAAAIQRVLRPPTGTTHCSVLNAKGEMSGVTTTSGLAWKLAGRCGDSPIIGAGEYTDQDVGSAGATGAGEENIKVAGAHTIVENMRHGMTPHEAGMDALKRIVRNFNGDMNKLRFLDMTYYILRKDGAWAGVSLWEGYGPGQEHSIGVIHQGGKRKYATTALFKGYSTGWPPIPEVK